MPSDAQSTAVILIVDDNPGDLRLAREVFEEAGVPAQVASAADGVDAVSMLRAVINGTVPAPVLVLLDINMPRMNGFEVLAFMKQQALLANIPVVMLSSSRRPADTARALELGAKDYLVKPESFDGYLELAASLVKYLPEG
ncbi:MAG: response regulator [Planctomycetes bacterium]|nr:response regulator [Planctomycetota bacterium]